MRKIWREEGKMGKAQIVSEDSVQQQEGGAELEDRQVQYPPHHRRVVWGSLEFICMFCLEVHWG